MILVDLDESYQNIPKSFHIVRKKVVLLWGQKSCFQDKIEIIHNCNKIRQGLSELPSYDLT
jgi:hypothetical protein